MIAKIAIHNILSIRLFASSSRFVQPFSSSDGKDKNNHNNDTANNQNQKYTYPYNFNREEYRGYIKKVQKAVKSVQESEQRDRMNIVPRRQRRVYDRPRFDTDTTNYTAWRLYDPEDTAIKSWEHGLKVAAKLQLQPKWVVHAFGKGLIPINHINSCSLEYVFEDVDLSTYLLYEYRNTTAFKPNDPDFDYENQEDLLPKKRKILRLDPKQFWQSEEKFEFRLNSTQYSAKFKFCTWLQETIEKRKSQPSYDQIIDEKFGKAYTFNIKSEQSLFKPRQPYIRYVTPASYAEEQKKSTGKKQKGNKKQAKVQQQPPKTENVPKKQSDQHVFQHKLPEKYRRVVKGEKISVEANK